MKKLFARNRVIDYDATKMFEEDPDIDAASSTDIDDDDIEFDERDLDDNPDWDDADDWEIIEKLDRDNSDSDSDADEKNKKDTKENKKNNKKEDNKKEDRDDEEESNDENDSSNDNDGEYETDEEESSDTQQNDVDDNYDPEPEEPELPELSEELLNKLTEALQEQEKFINGEEEKVDVDDDKNDAIDSMEDAGVEMETVGKECSVKGVNAIVIKKLTQSIIDTDPFKVFSDRNKNQNTENIENGIRLGTMLGRKIQIRNEERVTKYTRLKNGRIDKRLISSIGYGAEQIFSQLAVDVFNPVYVHISVDASGSMSGKKWNKTMIATVAICKAASMVSNLDVSVDFRLTTDNIGYNVPLVIIAYDSRKDKFEKIRRLFPYIGCPGITPEGLCFEAISKYIKEDKNTDQYFINFSDGAPYFSTTDGMRYEGRPAVEHTRKQVEKMRDKGIKILSYFIKDSSDGTFDDFKRMYGKDAKDIDVNEIVPLAKTLNAMFAEK